MRVLIVEDDEELSNQMQQSLLDAGYAVDVAHDGEDGHFLGDTE
ncbi:MAG: DNA-binding response regulator, partial [Kordiimonas sp.]